ncbi:aspartyl-tRNA amidotransferase [Croceicoccus estronivorus]|uniref:GatB/YqeY domain-containing protein n=1 Tax=Croceicoccus estronivorus TaxID=1172626 RepID=UPI00082A888D|nr:GatB/YqeY domain-containing protein [Croceicoccus estronivorus]OCC24737.1 aspartyl-tRNA amidotransferase [Croceicoccus estronivorus]
MLRDSITQAQKDAMKAREKDRLAAIRLILAKIKDRDIELRTSSATGDDDAIIGEVLQKMAKQRRESIAMYEDGGRQELADQEKGELAVIEEFLPQQMSEDQMKAAIGEIKTELSAESIKDMGKVMGELKARYAGQMDFGRASSLVKASFG